MSKFSQGCFLFDRNWIVSGFQFDFRTGSVVELGRNIKEKVMFNILNEGKKTQGQLKQI